MPTVDSLRAVGHSRQAADLAAPLPYLNESENPMLNLTPYIEAAQAVPMEVHQAGDSSVLMHALMASGKLHAAPGDITRSIQCAIDDLSDRNYIVTMPASARRGGGLVIDITDLGRNRFMTLERPAEVSKYSEATGRAVIEQSDRSYERWMADGCPDHPIFKRPAGVNDADFSIEDHDGNRFDLLHKGAKVARVEWDAVTSMWAVEPTFIVVEARRKTMAEVVAFVREQLAGLPGWN